MRTFLIAFLAGVLLLGTPGLRAADEVLSPFPRMGGEYVLGAERKVLPPDVCGDGRILFLEHGTGPWYLVAFVYPRRYHFSPTRVGTAWINIDRVNYFEEVEDRNRRVPDPRR